MSATKLTVEVRAALAIAFPPHIHGYHMLMDEPLKEATWEPINRDILRKAGVDVSKTANGSHASGADIECSLGALSNKSAQYEKGGIKISSYRLSSVCSDAHPGDITAIIAEIERRKNFQFYSVLVRKETTTHIQYDWFLVPADHPQFSPATYTWKPKQGKIGAKKDIITGWETTPHPTYDSSMSITFSMSSQLWINIPNTETLTPHLIASCEAKKGRTLDYADLYDRMS